MPRRATYTKQVASWFHQSVARLPGLVVIAIAVLVAYAFADKVPGLGAATVAILIGLLAVNLGFVRPSLQPGIAFASRQLLRLSIVLLGLQLALAQLLELGGSSLMVVVVAVGITFFGTRYLGRLLRVSPARSLLVATGFSICGASAVAAMKEVSDGDEDDAAMAIALVTLCGSLAIFLLPALRGPLGLDPVMFGSWVGASVHDVGQTVATASRVEGALTTAVVVKLSRVVMLAPLVAGVAILQSRRRGRETNVKRPPLVPLFVVGFLAAIVIRSFGVLPDSALSVASAAQKILLVAALVGLGTGIKISTLRATGGRTLILGLASWMIIGVVAYVGVKIAT